MKTIKPIYLFADSQLLFLKNEKREYYLKSWLNRSDGRLVKAAYIGTSNGNIPQFYSLFVEAMNVVGISDCKMISSISNQEDKEFLDEADVVLLSGGDTELGLKVFKKTGIGEAIQRSYHNGAILIGISAGAIQLGLNSSCKSNKKYSIIEALKLVPFNVLGHASDSIEEIEAMLKASDTIKQYYEIPFGAGLIFYPDETLEAIRKPINEYRLKEDKLMHTLLLPLN